MTQYEGKEYLTTAEASSMLGINSRTLDRYAKEKLITKYKQGISGRVMYRKSELEELQRRRNQILPEEEIDQ